MSVSHVIFFPRRILDEHGLVRYHSNVKSRVYASVNRAHFDPFHFGRTPISAGPNQVYSRDDDNNKQPRRSRRHQQQSAENQVCSCDDDNNNNKQPRRPRRRQQQSAKNQVYSRDNNKQQQQTTAKTLATTQCYCSDLTSRVLEDGMSTK